MERPPGRVLTSVIVPDALVVSWLPAALATVRRLVRAGDVDCLVTFSPPESTHLIGLLLGRRRPAWVAEFRDGWRFEPLRESFPTAAQRSFDGWLEQRVANAAEVVVGVTRPIAEDAGSRLHANAAWVSNGFDPHSLDEGTRVQAPGVGVRSIVYTGTLRIRGFDPEPLVHALARLARGPTAVRLVVAGSLTRQDVELFDRLGVHDSVEFVGRVSHAEALALQRSGDAVLLVAGADRSIATSKLFEYLAAGRPIVALAKGNEAERIVRETNTGVTVAPDDIDAITEALRQVATGELTGRYDPQQLEAFTYPALADAMADLIEAAIARRSGRSLPGGS